jgi:hypothetical protein
VPDRTARPATLVCVTGMHRSGTSMVAALLELLGVDFGPRESMLEPATENPHGFWEQHVVSDLNDHLLATLGGSWREPPILADGWESSSTLDPIRERIDDTVARLFGRRGTAGLKDPRLSLLLPLWRTRCAPMPSVLVLRDPRQVAQSLEQRNGIHSERSAYLWLRYLAAAWRNDPDHLLVHATELFDDLDGTLDRVCSSLKLDPPSGEARAAIAQIVDPAAWRASPKDATGPMMRRAVALHERLRAGEAVGAEIDRLHRHWLRRAEVERWLARPRRRLATAVPRQLRAKLAAHDRIRYPASAPAAPGRRGPQLRAHSER